MMSVVIPTFNRCDRLKRLLTALEREWATGAPPFEVIVVVDGSTDGTRGMLEAFKGSFWLRALYQENGGPAKARNRGMAAASGELLLFLDDDVIPQSGLIAAHLARHRLGEEAAVIGPMIAPLDIPLAPWLRWEAAMLRKQYNAMMAGQFAPTPRQFWTANASLHRRHVVAAGGFNESLRRAEDVEFAFRLQDLGLEFLFAPDAIVLHEPDRGYASWRGVPYEYGRSDVAMARDCGREFVLDLAFKEWHTRNVWNRRLARWAVGRPIRMQAVLHIMGSVIRHSGRGAGERLRLAACSAVFMIQYWQGIADATGCGAHVWELAASAEVSLASAAANIGRDAD